MFNGFRSLSANFTPTPNQFFDEVLGHYPSRVVTVVGILIRSTLGWEDPDTGERRVEAELPLSSFIRPDLCENSARNGLAEAIAAGLIVRTVAANSREGARYALRWADGAALERALEKSRRMHGMDLPSPTSGRSRGPKSSPLGDDTRGELSRGPKNAPPYIDKTKSPIPEKKEKKEKKEQTLNVDALFNFVAEEEQSQRLRQEIPETRIQRSGHADRLEKAVKALVAELQDMGSERRHRQLLEICQEHGLEDLSRLALVATRRRLDQENKRGPLENPGAYYQRILLKKLEEHQVFVPKAGEDDPEEVRRLARQSLGIELSR